MKSAFFLILAIAILSGCKSTQMIRELNSPGKYTASSDQKFLKVHLKDGSLFILDDWQIDSNTEVIKGSGNYYNYTRDKLPQKINESNATENFVYTIYRDEIALIETNRLTGQMANMSTITIVGVPLSLVGLYCISNPKACFGSCPTFYTFNNDKWELVAEGFSSSILPAFEKQDIDMLYRTTNDTNNLQIKLTNEALETHINQRSTGDACHPVCQSAGFSA